MILSKEQLLWLVSILIGIICVLSISILSANHTIGDRLEAVATECTAYEPRIRRLESMAH